MGDTLIWSRMTTIQNSITSLAGLEGGRPSLTSRRGQLTIGNMHRGPISQVLLDELKRSDSLRQVAERAGITHSALTRFVNGERGLSLSTADRLAAHFRMTLTRKAR